MLLSQITTRPDKYQFRETPWSEKTVASIVAEGIDLAKFDPIPVTPEEGGLYCVAGDGHSRYEAVRRLAERSALPERWLVDGDSEEWDIPVRMVGGQEARVLAWTANMSRADFTPVEEARVFKAMLESGMTIDDVARLVHRSATYVRSALPLNSLCREIREQIGKSVDAGGIDKATAQAMAERFERHRIGVIQQRDLWHRVLSKVYLTPAFARAAIDKVASLPVLAESDGLLFELPESADSVIERLKDRARHVRWAQYGIEYLMMALPTGVLGEFPELAALLERHGKQWLAAVKAMNASDAEIVAGLCSA